MKIFIGIGNPGTDYEKTRHNTGFMVVDELRKVLGGKDGSDKGKQLKFFKSDRFMNESGVFVKRIADKYKLTGSNLYVIHDDLDIKLGEYKIQFGRGPKDHNGIKSIDTELGTKEYWHVRVGVDNRPLDNRVMGEEYVLQNFSDDEFKTLNKTLINLVGKLIHHNV